MQSLANGAITGLTIAVLALAFTVVYLPTRIFHIALGGVYTVVPFIVWTALRQHYPWPVAVIIALSAGVTLSLLCELLNHSYLDRKQASSGAHLVSSLGIYIMITQITVIIWGNESKALRTGLDENVIYGHITLTRAQVISAIISLIILVTFYAWLRFSTLGLRFRALADNPVEFSLRGYNLRLFRWLAFILAGFLCSISSLLVSHDVGFDPHAGLASLLIAIVAVIIGGRGSFFGPVIGGLLIGIIRSEVVWFLSARWQDAVTFLLLAVFLFIYPNGVCGRKRRLEAEA